jgi:hypothetical protein
MIRSVAAVAVLNIAALLAGAPTFAQNQSQRGLTTWTASPSAAVSVAGSSIMASMDMNGDNVRIDWAEVERQAAASDKTAYMRNLAKLMLAVRDKTYQPMERTKSGDPYDCFGAGRYDAMREGRVCPGWDQAGEAACRPPDPGKVCMVVRQEGITCNIDRGYATDEGSTTFPCSMDFYEALDYWRRRPQLGWWNHGFGSDGREH